MYMMSPLSTSYLVFQCKLFKTYEASLVTHHHINHLFPRKGIWLSGVTDQPAVSWNNECLIYYIALNPCLPLWYHVLTCQSEYSVCVCNIFPPLLQPVTQPNYVLMSEQSWNFLKAFLTAYIQLEIMGRQVLNLNNGCYCIAKKASSLSSNNHARHVMLEKAKSIFLWPNHSGKPINQK